MSEVMRLLEAEKTARVAAEGELRRQLAQRDATATREADENKQRLDRVEVRDVDMRFVLCVYVFR